MKNQKVFKNVEELRYYRHSKLSKIKLNILSEISRGRYNSTKRGYDRTRGYNRYNNRSKRRDYYNPRNQYKGRNWREKDDEDEKRGDLFQLDSSGLTKEEEIRKKEFEKLREMMKRGQKKKKKKVRKKKQKKTKPKPKKKKLEGEVLTEDDFLKSFSFIEDAEKSEVDLDEILSKYTPKKANSKQKSKFFESETEKIFNGNFSQPKMKIPSFSDGMDDVMNKMLNLDKEKKKSSSRGRKKRKTERRQGNLDENDVSLLESKLYENLNEKPIYLQMPNMFMQQPMNPQEPYMPQQKMKRESKFFSGSEKGFVSKYENAQGGGGGGGGMPGQRDGSSEVMYNSYHQYMNRNNFRGGNYQMKQPMSKMKQQQRPPQMQQGSPRNSQQREFYPQMYNAQNGKFMNYPLSGGPPPPQPPQGGTGYGGYSPHGGNVMMGGQQKKQVQENQNKGLIFGNFQENSRFLDDLTAEKSKRKQPLYLQDIEKNFS